VVSVSCVPDAVAPAVSIADAWFGYEPATDVLRGASLEVESGSVHCLMGPNGCGKSTLLDCVLGFNRLRQGEVTVQGRDVRTLTPRDLARLVAYVPQKHDRSFPYLVEQVVLMGRTPHQRMLGAPDAEDRVIARESLETVGIAALADRPYTHLSGGEAQLVLLARALTQRTPLILMDEPAAHLDLGNSLRFLETVSALVRERGCTVLMATHHPEQPFFLESTGCSVTVSLMGRGRVRASGKPARTITEQSLADVFGVEARLLTEGAGESGAQKGFVFVRTRDTNEGDDIDRN